MPDQSPCSSSAIKLPVASNRSRKAGPRKASRAGKWRTLTLVLVYVIFIAHFMHWWIAGETLTPVEPSESMQTLEQGLLNAGFILFALALLSTLILGRWFCGWTCHIIALQDLCTWTLKKLHIRPRPFRSRLLMFVPLLAALYMFVWPSVRRIWDGDPAPALVSHFFTEDYWATFPGVTMSIVTFVVCGFVIVYLLGNKGYCTYACPYGGFFALADQFAPGKIRVTDACNQCGHCTAACTSNVRVHEEVRVHGMVVDPGCMKCTDCISVCPNDALYYGFGRPSTWKGKPRATPRPRRASYRWWEEALLAVSFLAALYAVRGLYDLFPFLLSLGIAAIAAYLVVQLVRMPYTDNLRLHQLQLRRDSRTTVAGWSFAGMMALVVALFVHSGFVQYHDHEAMRLIERSRTLPAGPAEDGELRTTLADARAHLLWLDRYALVDTPKVQAQLGALYLYENDAAAAEPYLRRALDLAPDYGAARHKWAELRAQRGEIEPALRDLRAALQSDPSLVDAREQLVEALQARGELADALAVLEMIVRRRPHDVLARRQLAQLLADSGRLPAALEQMREVVRQRSNWGPGVFDLGLMLARSGETDDGIERMREGLALQPSAVRPRVVAAQIALALDRRDFGKEALAEIPQIAPREPEALAAWATLVHRYGDLRAELSTRLAEAERAEAWYAVVFLYGAGGDRGSAEAAWARAAAADGSLTKPNFLSGN